MRSSISELADEVQRDLQAVLTGLDAEELKLRPAHRPEAWSIQQIGEHLRLSYDLTVYAYQDQLLKGRCTRARATLKQLLSQFWVLRLGNIPKGTQTSAAAEPLETMPGESGDKLLARILERLHAMQAVMRQAEKNFGRKKCVCHYYFGPMDAQSWMRFHNLHARLHVGHMRAILREAAGERRKLYVRG